ncbi:SSU ribosomal protein S6p [Desulfurella amilsii]|uniref:Small ribosomal subunit protein bS6 n=1 Tax=Desulfurella amilsii TaxID=1562698 RepID=A0A1X4XYM1_9BACT|nr:30S ribosomal protein S6 [Desulfurella amilsii]OSS42614.1 SSU ribosomal protein S6p [Desulfurella amilsii]
MHYDFLYIVQPNVTDEEFDTMLLDVVSRIESNGGKVLKKAIWGKKQLAYPIKKYRQGIYVNLFYEAPPTVPKQIESFLALKDDILRQMTVKTLKKDIARLTLVAQKTENTETQSETN